MKQNNHIYHNCEYCDDYQPQCPECDSYCLKLNTEETVYYFLFQDKVHELPYEDLTWKCDECGFSWTDWLSEDAQVGAIQEYIESLMLPKEELEKLETLLFPIRL